MCHPGVQRGLDKLEEWVCVKLMKSSKAKCQVLRLGGGSGRHTYWSAGEVTDSSPAEKDLGVLVDENLNMSQWNPGLH